MLKMIIRMDDDKINIEKKYRLDGIYSVIDDTFAKMGFPRVEDSSGDLIYCDNGLAQDYSRFGKVVNMLKKQTWFMENVVVWRFCDSDDSDSPNDFNEEDLLKHYTKKQTMEGHTWRKNISKQ